MFLRFELCILDAPFDSLVVVVLVLLPFVLLILATLGPNGPPIFLTNVRVCIVSNIPHMS